MTHMYTIVVANHSLATQLATAMMSFSSYKTYINITKSGMCSYCNKNGYDATLLAEQKLLIIVIMKVHSKNLHKYRLIWNSVLT